VSLCKLASRIRMELQFHSDSARKLSANLYDIYHCCVYSEQIEVRECLLSFGAESVVFQVAVQKLKDQDM